MSFISFLPVIALLAFKMAKPVETKTGKKEIVTDAEKLSNII
jgi:hypothetical protein